MNLAPFRPALLKLIVPAFIFLIVFPVTFVFCYIYFNHRQYLDHHYAFQAQEVSALKEWSRLLLNDLNALLQVTGARIHSAGQNLKAVQTILSSVSSFQNNLPSFQQVSYNRLIPPQAIVTRFGILPLTRDTVPINIDLFTPPNSPIFTIKDKTVTGFIILPGSDGALEGILEVQADLADFNYLLERYQTLCLASEIEDAPPALFKTQFFTVYAKPPHTLKTYALTHKVHYSIFAVYSLLTLVIGGILLVLLDQRLYKNSHKKLTTLETSLGEASSTVKSLEEKVLMHQQAKNIHQLSCREQNIIQAHLQDRQKEQAANMVLLLNSLQSSFSVPFTEGQAKKTGQILQTCLHQATALSEGLWDSLEKETVDLTLMLDELQALFAEKIHKSNITVTVNLFPDGAGFYGDSLLTRLILANIIGKACYRLSKNGAISISAHESAGFLELTIQDNGYFVGEAAEKLIRQFLPVFVADTAFHQLCLKGGFDYQWARNGNQSNTSCLKIPLQFNKVSPDNVIKLFS